MRYRWPKKEIKKAVQVVLLNEQNQVLAVSRKTDHKDFGLPGGKVDGRETPEQAIIRETKEETGLDISFLELVFASHRWGYMGYTYTAKYCGEIHTTEPHIVKWANYEEVLKGSFGKWNKMVLDSLRDMGTKIKVYPDPKEEWLFHIDEFEGDFRVSICSKKFHDEKGHFPDIFSSEEWKEISNLAEQGELEFLEDSENVFRVYKGRGGKGNYKIELMDRGKIEEAMTEAGFTKGKF
jgi:mutator protein MutT